MLCQQVRKKGLQLPIAAAEWAATEKLIDLGGEAVEGIILNQYFDRSSPAPQYIAFRSAYKERFGDEPGFAAVNAFDAANLVMDAIGRQQKDESLKDVIIDIGNFEGVQGLVRVDRYGDADRKTFLTSIRQGKFVLLE